MKKKLVGIILPALLIGFFGASVLAYPAGAGNAVSHPWEAVQLTAYKITGQEEKAAEIEDRIENGQPIIEKLEEVLP